MRYSHINYNGRTANHTTHPSNFNAKEIMPKKASNHGDVLYTGIQHSMLCRAKIYNYPQSRCHRGTGFVRIYYGWSLPLTFLIGETGGICCCPERYINFFFHYIVTTQTPSITLTACRLYIFR